MILIVSSCGLCSATVCFLSKHEYSKHLLLCYAVCCASLVLLCLHCYFTFSTKHHTILSLPGCLPLPPLCLFLSLCRYLCFCICASLLHFVSSHPLPTHTHTQCPCTVGSVYVHRSTWDNFFFLFFSSHLAALYSNYPRRGLTAGNINRMACSDIEHTHSCTTCTHTCKHTTLIVLTEPWPTTQCPPVIYLFMTHYYVSHPVDALILMGL